ncbi:MAG: DUF6265 family protein [Thermoanaerobaculia bacterium]
MLRRSLPALLVLVLLPSLGSAQEALTEHTLKLAEGASAASVDLDELAWLAGRWTGEGLGGWVEEVWNPPAGGAITGTFRLLRDGKPLFYEFYVLADHGEGLTLRLKHFNADMTGWEEKEKYVEFPFIGVIDGVLHFRGLAYQRDSDDRMTIYLALTTKEGMREEVFRLKRVP